MVYSFIEDGIIKRLELEKYCALNVLSTAALEQAEILFSPPIF